VLALPCHDLSLTVVIGLGVCGQWVRFMQNIRRYRDTGDRMPHLANAFKYALAQAVVLFSYGSPALSKASQHSGMRPVQVVWVVMFVTSTLYTFYWDVRMDWGLKLTRSTPLRPVLMLKHRWMYFAAVCVDFVLRFVWTYQLIPQTFLPYWTQSGTANYSYYVATLLACLELGRRFMWAIIR
jgi:xenotropic and polytropic retrovirus receptor 1